MAPVRLQKGQGLKPEAVEANQASLWLWGPGLGTDIRVPTILEGRLPDPSAPGEAIVSRRHAKDLGVGVGSTFTPLATTRADIECIVAQTCDQDRPFTVPVPIEIVGIAQFPDDLDDDAFAEQVEIEVGPATLTAMADEIGVVGRVLGVRFDDSDPGAPALDGSSGERFGELLQFFQKAAGPDVLEQFSIYDTNPAQITSTDALRLQVTGLVLGGALLALVSFGAASVLFSRHLQPSAPDQPILAALGLRRIERFAPLALEAAIAATVATAIAVVVAVALSPLLPFGVGRVAEPDPGLAFDSTALVLGGGLLALLLAVVLALVAYRSIVRPAHGRSATTSLTLAGRLRLQPVPATGTRFALEGRSEGWRAPVILTVGAAAVATALVTDVAAPVLEHRPRADDAVGGREPVGRLRDQLRGHPSRSISSTLDSWPMTTASSPRPGSARVRSDSPWARVATRSRPSGSSQSADGSSRSCSAARHRAARTRCWSGRPCRTRSASTWVTSSS